MSQNQACLALRLANLAAFPAPRPWLRSVVGVVVCCGFPCWGTASVQAQSRGGQRMMSGPGGSEGCARCSQSSRGSWAGGELRNKRSTPSSLSPFDMIQVRQQMQQMMRNQQAVALQRRAQQTRQLNAPSWNSLSRAVDTTSSSGSQRNTSHGGSNQTAQRSDASELSPRGQQLAAERQRRRERYRRRAKLRAEARKSQSQSENSREE